MNSFKVIWLCIACTVFISSCSSPQQESTSSGGWRSVYKNDEDGSPIRGDKDELIRAIRNGYDVRVGWGWEHTIGDSLVRLEHMAEPLFTIVIQEKHVSVVIDAHPLLKNYFDIDQQSFREGGAIWQTVLTTQGTFNAQVYDRSSGELLKDWPQTHQMTWFVDYPNTAQYETNIPLYEKR